MQGPLCLAAKTVLCTVLTKDGSAASSRWRHGFCPYDASQLRCSNMLEPGGCCTRAWHAHITTASAGFRGGAPSLLLKHRFLGLGNWERNSQGTKPRGKGLKRQTHPPKLGFEEAWTQRRTRPPQQLIANKAHKMHHPLPLYGVHGAWPQQQGPAIHEEELQLLIQSLPSPMPPRKTRKTWLTKKFTCHHPYRWSTTRFFLDLNV